MNAYQILSIFADIVNLLKNLGYMHTDGKFVFPPNAADEAALAGKIEQILKANGVDVPEKVDAVINLLPLIFQMLG